MGEEKSPILVYSFLLFSHQRQAVRSQKFGGKASSAQDQQLS
jgi:hypothetical protein